MKRQFHLAWFLSQGYGPKTWRSAWPGSVIRRAIEWIRWTRPIPRSRRFEDAECDDATGKETMAAGVGWNVPATA
jgi:hypothetical protein